MGREFALSDEEILFQLQEKLGIEEAEAKKCLEESEVRNY